MLTKVNGKYYKDDREITAKEWSRALARGRRISQYVRKCLAGQLALERVPQDIKLEVIQQVIEQKQEV